MDSRIYKIAAILAIATFVAGVVLVFTPRRRGDKIEAVDFKIERGQSLGSIARLLSEKKLIYSRYLFVAYAVLSGHEKDFKAGKYLISQPVSTQTLVSIFSRGLAEPEDVIITIPEGTNTADIDRILAEADMIKAGEFLATALPYEGYLFPDTYHLHNSQQPTASRQQRVTEIIKKMKESFETKTTDLFKRLSELKIKEIIIIASILEKEVKTQQDMRLVAGIIERRLELGMPLEIDATVAYGVCYPKFLSGNACDVSLASIVDNIPKDSVYNTYKRKGLPIGPISNPGLRAMDAALNPQPSDFLFYLSAKNGTTVFSRTATEHLRARQKYLFR